MCSDEATLPIYSERGFYCFGVGKTPITLHLRNTDEIKKEKENNPEKVSSWRNFEKLLHLLAL